MNRSEDLEDRMFDSLLEEAAGRGPDPDLERRTLAALATEATALGAQSGRRTTLWAARAVALMAASIVLTIALWHEDDRDAETVSGKADETATTQDPRRDPREWIEELRDFEKADAAAAALVRAGPAAVPALVAALGDERAARARVLEVLDALEADAAPALAEIAKLILELPVDSQLLGPAFRAAATLVPHAPDRVRHDARRAVLLVAFAKAGPAAGGNVARGGPAPRQPYSLREVARLLHREHVDREADTEALLEFLQDESPYRRALAARWLGTHREARVLEALRGALFAVHPSKVLVQWSLEEGYRGDFSYNLEYDRVIRMNAARSLVQMAGHEDASAPGHAHLLQHGTLREQRAAARSLAHLRVEPGDRTVVLAALAAALEHEDRAVLLETLTALTLLEVKEEAVRARLRAFAEHEDVQIAARAAAALRRG